MSTDIVTVYKVCRWRSWTESLEDHQFAYRNSYHSFLESGWAVNYELGEITHPRIGVLFAFDSESRADEWVAIHKRYQYLAVLKCEAKKYEGGLSIRKPNGYYFKEKTRIFETFWKHQRHRMKPNDADRIAPPADTVMCEWIKPIQILSRTQQLMAFN